jgi:hypothetical protein
MNKDKCRSTCMDQTARTSLTHACTSRFPSGCRSESYPVRYIPSPFALRPLVMVAVTAAFVVSGSGREARDTTQTGGHRFDTNAHTLSFSRSFVRSCFLADSSLPSSGDSRSWPISSAASPADGRALKPFKVAARRCMLKCEQSEVTNSTKEGSNVAQDEMVLAARRACVD